jgi:hypothetical protein
MQVKRIIHVLKNSFILKTSELLTESFGLRLFFMRHGIHAHWVRNQCLPFRNDDIPCCGVVSRKRQPLRTGTILSFFHPPPLSARLLVELMLRSGNP